MVVYGYSIMFYKVIMSEKHRVTISTMSNLNDLNYTHTILTTTFDVCKARKRVLPTFYSKTIFHDQNYTSSIKCPYQLNTLRSFENLTVTDAFLPPLPETKVKLEIVSYGIVKDQKGWKFLKRFTHFVRVKKDFFPEKPKSFVVT